VCSGKLSQQLAARYVSLPLPGGSRPRKGARGSAASPARFPLRRFHSVSLAPSVPCIDRDEPFLLAAEVASRNAANDRQTATRWVAFNPLATKNALRENFHFPALNTKKHSTTADESSKSAKADCSGAVVCSDFGLVARKIAKSLTPFTAASDRRRLTCRFWALASF
jgi:hypothetical protein